jgi:hypothetical protein
MRVGDVPGHLEPVLGRTGRVVSHVGDRSPAVPYRRRHEAAEPKGPVNAGLPIPLRRTNRL